ncbi:MAG: ATP-binding cassette domain-containing protein [Lachnospiraceae bacterium]|nr:ATP-binding cassette domain-containing protein [Lachnospiraceae bacterium]
MSDRDFFESQIDIRSRLDEKQKRRAFEKLAAGIGAAGVFGTGPDEGGELLDRAVRLCLKYYGHSTGKAPGGVTQPEERLEYLCRPCSVMHRSVTLKDDWEKNAFGPMMGKLKSGEYAAIIPGGLGGYYYTDPRDGKRKRITKKNRELFEEEAVFFYRSLPAGRLGKNDLLFFMLGSLDAGDFILVFLAALAAALTGLLPPWANKLGFSLVVPSGNSSLVAPIAALLFGVAVSALLINACRNLLMGRVSIKMGIYAESAGYARLMNLPVTFFRKYNSGDLAVRITSLRELAEVLTLVAAGSGLTCLLSLIYLFQIARYAHGLVVPAFLTVLAQGLFTVIAFAVTLRFEKKKTEANAGLSGTVTSMLAGIQKIKLAGAENRAFAKWANKYSAYSGPAYNRPALLQALPSIITVTGIVGTVFIYHLASKSGIRYDDYMAFNVAYGQMSAAILAAAGIAQSVVRVGPLFDLVSPLLSEIPEDSSDMPIVENLRGSVEISNIYFRYSEKSAYVLEDISFKVRPGEYVAITGHSGCGKSTLVRLLLGFEKPEKGSIFYDSNNLASVDAGSVRRHIGTVMQNSRLFVGNILYNIIISSPEASLDDAWEAAKLAGIAEDIGQMPMGMKTLISEGGSGLSGGQRQRLMIARAICKKPEILIFDEATSALDNITQKHVSDSLDALKCTRIVVAHRLSTIKNCDRILCLDRGRIVEEGTYDELMAKNGFFAELVSKQQLDK